MDVEFFHASVCFSSCPVYPVNNDHQILLHVLVLLLCHLHNLENLINLIGQGQCCPGSYYRNYSQSQSACISKKLKEVPNVLGEN